MHTCKSNIGNKSQSWIILGIRTSLFIKTKMILENSLINKITLFLLSYKFLYILEIQHQIDGTRTWCTTRHLEQISYQNGCFILELRIRWWFRPLGIAEPIQLNSWGQYRQWKSLIPRLQLPKILYDMVIIHHVVSSVNLVLLFYIHMDYSETSWCVIIYQYSIHIREY